MSEQSNKNNHDEMYDKQSLNLNTVTEKDIYDLYRYIVE